MRYKRVLLLLASLLLPGPLHPARDEPLTISLFQLLANPERLDRKSVTVEGYLHMEHEPHHPPLAVLFFHEEDANNLLGWNAVAVQPTDRMLRDEEKIDRMYVMLTGTVRATPAGNGGFVLLIVDVQRCDPWSDPRHPLGLKGDGNKPGLKDDRSRPSLRDDRSKPN